MLRCLLSVSCALLVAGDTCRAVKEDYKATACCDDALEGSYTPQSGLCGRFGEIVGDMHWPQMTFFPSTYEKYYGNTNQEFASYALVIQSHLKAPGDPNNMDAAFVASMIACDADWWTTDQLTAANTNGGELCNNFKCYACDGLQSFNIPSNVLLSGGCPSSEHCNDNGYDRQLNTDGTLSERSPLNGYWRSKFDDARKLSRCMSFWGLPSVVYTPQDHTNHGIPQQTTGGHVSAYDLDCVWRAFENELDPDGANAYAPGQYMDYSTGQAVDRFTTIHGKAMAKVYDMLRSSPEHRKYVGGPSDGASSPSSAEIMDFSIYYLGGVQQTPNHSPA